MEWEGGADAIPDMRSHGSEKNSLHTGVHIIGWSTRKARTTGEMGLKWPPRSQSGCIYSCWEKEEELKKKK